MFQQESGEREILPATDPITANNKHRLTALKGMIHKYATNLFGPEKKHIILFILYFVPFSFKLATICWERECFE